VGDRLGTLGPAGQDLAAATEGQGSQGGDGRGAGLPGPGVSGDARRAGAVADPDGRIGGQRCRPTWSMSCPATRSLCPPGGRGPGAPLVRSGHAGRLGGHPHLSSPVCHNNGSDESTSLTSGFLQANAGWLHPAVDPRRRGSTPTIPTPPACAHGSSSCGSQGALARDLPETALHLTGRRPRPNLASALHLLGCPGRAVAHGDMNHPSINGMQGSGFNPPQLHPGQRPSPASTAPESPAPGSKSAAICLCDANLVVRHVVDVARIVGVVDR
jgi:hypothetical protein